MVLADRTMRGCLLAAGGTGGVDLGASLIAWFEALFDIRKAADKLFIHPNTVRYRLRRITELTGLDLDNADECLGLWLQLRAQRETNSAAQL